MRGLLKFASYEGPIEREFIRGMITHVRHSVLSNILGVLLLLIVCLLAPFGKLLAIGLAVRLAAIANTSRNARSLRRALDESQPIDRLINVTAFGLFGAGASWSLLVALIPTAHLATFPAMMVFGVVLTGVSLISATSAPVPRVMWAFLSGFFLVGSIWMARLVDAFGIMPIIAVAGISIAIIYFSLGMMREARRSAELLVMNTELAARLTTLNKDLASAMEQATYLADHDQLTGLYNRRAFDERMHLIKDEGRQAEFSLLLIDLDHFKRINDCCGHAAGDAVLKATGELLWEVADLLPRGAFPGRIGGEEFALLIPLLHGEALEEFASTLCLRFRTLPAPDNFEGEISASIGHARWREDEPVHHVFQRTDRALYKAKFAGRDRAIAA